jgi:hypothetical protein
MQRRYKHAFQTIERLCPCKMVTKKGSFEKRWLSFETPAYQDMTLGAQELY